MKKGVRWIPILGFILFEKQVQKSSPNISRADLMPRYGFTWAIYQAMIMSAVLAGTILWVIK